MYLPLFQPTRDSLIQGDVYVHASAVIAPGVLLQAESGSQLIIGPGVCIGMGCILHAYQGRLEIGEGVILGAGTLILGQGKIEANCCIGSATTILNPTLNSGSVIPPGSLVGDESRKSLTLPGAEPVHQLQAAIEPQSFDSPLNQRGQVPDAPDPWSESAQSDAIASPSPATAGVPTANGSEPKQTPNSVYGQIQLHQLLVTLLPHRQYGDQSVPLQSSTDDD
jgi:carbon dioxide concentrating mechanism protein CcmN